MRRCERSPNARGGRGRTRGRRSAPAVYAGPRLYRPVSAWARWTGVDSGDPRSRNQLDTTTMLPTAKNSLCQFWNDANHQRAVPRDWSMDTGPGRGGAARHYTRVSHSPHGRARTPRTGGRAPWRENGHRASARAHPCAPARGPAARVDAGAGPRPPPPGHPGLSIPPSPAENTTVARTYAAICNNSLSQFSNTEAQKWLLVI